jgi:tripartite-type tricarboxylate transporter receptor subunit TctC
MSRFSLLRFVSAAVLSTGLAAGGIAAPAAAQDFWAGKTVTLIVGTEAGSGYDVYGRLVVRHIVKYLPGRPLQVAQNLTGAGSKRAAEHMFVVAPKDGTAISIVFPGAIAEPLITERSKWRYDPSKFEFLGTADSGTRLCSTTLEAKVKTFDQAQKEVATIGASAPGGSTFDYPTMLNALAGAKFKVVSGYKGTVEIAVAMERGEVDGWCGVEISTYTAVRPDWLPKRQVSTLIQLGLEPSPEMTAMGIPSIWKYVPPENRKAMELIVSQQVFQRPFIAPPGTPADRVLQLQSAFMATMKDAEFLAEAAKMKLTVGPRSGPEVAALVSSMYGASQDVIDQVARAVKP